MSYGHAFDVQSFLEAHDLDLEDLELERVEDLLQEDAEMMERLMYSPERVSYDAPVQVVSDWFLAIWDETPENLEMS